MNWCFWTVVLEKTLESPLDCKEIQPVHSRGDQPWDFFGRNDAKAETPVLWPPHAKSWVTGKDSDAGRDWGQEEKGMTEDEMVGWHHWPDGCESEWTPGVGDGQGGLVCCDSRGHKELDTTERLNWSELNLVMSMCRVFSCVVGRGCLLWSMNSLGKTLWTFALLYSVLQRQICLLLQVFLDPYFCIPVPYNEKDIFFGSFSKRTLVLKGLVGLHWTIQLQLLRHYWLGHRLVLPWYWVVCLGNEQRSFCRCWDCIQVLHFGLFCWLWWLLHFF